MNVKAGIIYGAINAAVAGTVVVSILAPKIAAMPKEDIKANLKDKIETAKFTAKCVVLTPVIPFLKDE